MPVTVGLIANPAAGRDIRRLTAHASVVPNHEKASIVRRVLHGLAATGVDTVVYLADNAGIVAAAVDGGRPPLAMDALDLRAHGWASDSTEAARGLAAGLVATGTVAADRVTRRVKRVEVQAAGTADFALIDAAACTDPFVGTRAIWDVGRVRALVLTRAEPWSVGLSAIGGGLRPLAPDEPMGLYVELGDGPEGVAAVAPGVVARVPVRRWRLLELDEPVVFAGDARTVALDGERELAVDGGATAAVTLNGPRLVDIRATLQAAVGNG